MITSQKNAARTLCRKLGTADKDYAFASVRNQIFDAVATLFERRSDQGLTQVELAEALDRHPAWVSRKLGGPSNWTLRTLAEFVEALNGHLVISAQPIEEAQKHNYDFYNEFSGWLAGQNEAYADAGPSTVRFLGEEASASAGSESASKLELVP